MLNTDLSDFKNIYHGQKAFVCGAGPSIRHESLREIEKHVVVAVNSSIMLFDWKNCSNNKFWVSNDSLCVDWSYFHDNLIPSKCVKIVRESWYKPYHNLITKHGFRYFKTRKSQKIPLSKDDGGLCFCSSVPTAIDLCLWMGCKEIILLGADHQMEKGKSHFWQFWPKSKWPKRNGRDNYSPEQSHQIKQFNVNMSVYQSLEEYAKNSCSAKIINCTMESKIQCFEKKKLSDVI